MSKPRLVSCSFCGRMVAFGNKSSDGKDWCGVCMPWLEVTRERAVELLVDSGMTREKAEWSLDLFKGISATTIRISEQHYRVK